MADLIVKVKPLDESNRYRHLFEITNNTASSIAGSVLSTDYRIRLFMYHPFINQSNDIIGDGLEISTISQFQPITSSFSDFRFTHWNNVSRPARIDVDDKRFNTDISIYLPAVVLNSGATISDGATQLKGNGSDYLTQISTQSYSAFNSLSYTESEFIVLEKRIRIINVSSITSIPGNNPKIDPTVITVITDTPHGLNTADGIRLRNIDDARDKDENFYITKIDDNTFTCISETFDVTGNDVDYRVEVWAWQSGTYPSESVGVTYDIGDVRPTLLNHQLYTYTIIPEHDSYYTSSDGSMVYGHDVDLTIGEFSTWTRKTALRFPVLDRLPANSIVPYRGELRLYAQSINQNNAIFSLHNMSLGSNDTINGWDEDSSGDLINSFMDSNQVIDTYQSYNSANGTYMHWLIDSDIIANWVAGILPSDLYVTYDSALSSEVSTVGSRESLTPPLLTIYHTVPTIDSPHIPIITLLGLPSIDIIQNSTFTDSGVIAMDYMDNDITSSVVVGGDTVDTSTLGRYVITYNVNDGYANAIERIRVVNVITGYPPYITIIGNNPDMLLLGESYIDSGASAYDTEDGDISNNIIINSNVNSNVIGSYTVEYLVTDSDNNSSVATRVVGVVSDDIPIITLLGSDPYYVIQNSTYVDPGATAIDSMCNLLTSNIIVTGVGDVDTSAAIGTEYYIYYNVSDADGNPAIPKTRLVIISTCNTITLGSSEGSIGDTVTIYSSTGGFLSPPKLNIVRFNGISARVLSGSADILQVVIPKGATTGDVIVESDNITCPLSNSIPFTVNYTNELFTVASKNGISRFNNNASLGALYNRDLGYSGFSEIVDETSILQNVYTIILTQKGERIFDPDFGTTIQRRLFSLMQGDVSELEYEVLNEIKLAVDKYEPRALIDMQKSFVDVNNNSNSIVIVLYIIVPGGFVREIGITLSSVKRV